MTKNVSILDYEKIRERIASGTGPGYFPVSAVELIANTTTSHPPGIYVYSPEGKELAYIKTEIPTNVGFGRGKEASTLYITAGKSLYRIRLNKAGYQLPAK